MDKIKWPIFTPDMLVKLDNKPGEYIVVNQSNNREYSTIKEFSLAKAVSLFTVKTSRLKHKPLPYLEPVYNGK